MIHPRDSYYDESSGKQLRPLPTHWMTPRKTLKIGGKVKLTTHIALRLGTRTPEFKDWDGICPILEVHNGSGSFPPHDIADEDDDEPVWSGQNDGYLVIALPYPYGVSTPPKETDKRTLCHLSSENVEWEVIS